MKTSLIDIVFISSLGPQAIIFLLSPPSHLDDIFITYIGQGEQIVNVNVDVMESLFLGEVAKTIKINVKTSLFLHIKQSHYYM